MSQQDIHGIPDVVAEYLQDHGITDVNIEYPLKLFLYDVQDSSSGEHVAYQSAFVQSILSLTSPDVALSLSPSTLVETTNFSVNAKFVSNKTSYDNRPQDAASFIFSQERPTYLIDRRLDLRDKFIVFSQESIYTGDDTTLKVDPNISIFVLDSEVPIYDVNGVYQYSLITLKKFISYKIQQTTQGEGLLGPYSLIRIEWFKVDIQPRDAKRRKITFKSKPILWSIDIKDGEQISVSWEKTSASSQWNEEVFLPIIRGTQVGFSPAWSVEKSFLENGLGNNRIWDQGDGRNFDIMELQGPIGGNEQGYAGGGYNDEGVIDLVGPDNAKHAFTYNSDRGVPVSDINADPSDQVFFPAYSASKSAFVSVLLSPSAPEIRTWLFSKSKIIYNFILPFSSTGIKSIATSEGETSEVSIPRKVEQFNAPWLTFGNENLLFFDAILHSVLVGAIGIGSLTSYVIHGIPVFNNSDAKQIMIDRGGHGNLPPFMNNYSPYIGSLLRAENQDKLLKRNLTWMGETITEKPQDILTSSFDFSPAPSDWDKNEMKKYLGLFPSDLLEIDKSNIDAVINRTAISATDSIIINPAIGGAMAIKYRSMANNKAYQMSQNFYINENGEYVIEVDWEMPIDLSYFEMHYFGGYSYIVEDFKNTREEANSGEGDIPCTFEFEGITYDLPPFTYDADNRRGDPRTAVVRKLYGGGGALKTTAHGILKKANKQSIKNNEKKIVNLQTGKLVKNLKYNKEKK